MILQILLVITGLALVVLGAEALVEGAGAIARKCRVSEFVIGITIVGFGTSCPELVVSLTGAFDRLPDVAAGNVIGSNIFNSLLILGLTALLSPIAISRGNRRTDIPLTLVATVIFVLLGMKGSIFGAASGNTLTAADGILFLILFAAYMIYTFKTGKPETGEDEAPDRSVSTATAILFTVGGLAALIFGGRIFVDNAVGIARAVGVSEKFIALTLLSGGTSLPELATCIIASTRKSNQLALGNILGSNVFNILFILGCSSIVTPLQLASINAVDLGVLLLSALLVFTSAFTGKKDCIDRFDGVLMLLAEAAYLVWLFANA